MKIRGHIHKQDALDQEKKSKYPLSMRLSETRNMTVRLDLLPCLESNPYLLAHMFLTCHYFYYATLNTYHFVFQGMKF